MAPTCPQCRGVGRIRSAATRFCLNQTLPCRCGCDGDGPAQPGCPSLSAELHRPLHGVIGASAARPLALGARIVERVRRGGIEPDRDVAARLAARIDQRLAAPGRDFLVGGAHEYAWAHTACSRPRTARAGRRPDRTPARRQTLLRPGVSRNRPPSRRGSRCRRSTSPAGRRARRPPRGACADRRVPRRHRAGAP